MPVKEYHKRTTPELARGLVYRLHCVHGLSGSALLSQARKYLQTEMAKLEASQKGK